MAGVAHKNEGSQKFGDDRGRIFESFVDKTELHFVWLSELQQELKKEASAEKAS